ncbi:GDSL-type esterase/lipase family protein [Macrococcus animalis]|uniref:GDSL-type esterase/lipase family protein n=1 Tax=Macrococcus animalis TaxID=3395467 RepID=UPI0039BE495D
MELKRTAIFDIDINKHNDFYNSKTFYSQDINTSFLSFNIFDRDTVVDIDRERIRVSMILKCGDGSVYDINEFDISNNVIKYKLNEQQLLRSGTTLGELFLYKDDKKISSARFRYNVKLSLNSIDVKQPITIETVKGELERLFSNHPELLPKSEPSGNNDLTYQEALDKGMPSYVDGTTYNQIITEKKEQLANDFALELQSENIFPNVETYLNSKINTMSHSLFEYAPIYNTFTSGYLPSLSGIPNTFIDFKNDMYTNNGADVNIIDFIYHMLSDINSGGSPLNNKNITIIGDSITEVNFRTQKNYHQFITERTGATFNNLGYSGTGFVSRVNVASEVNETPDAFIVFLGTNDWACVGHNNPLGSIEDANYTNVSGAINNMLQSLIEKFPFTPILLMTPLPRIESNGYNNRKNEVGYSLKELSELIVEYGKKYSLPVLDLFNESNLKPWIQENNKMFFAYQEGAEDGLHPNTAGHEYISHIIQSFIENKGVVGAKRVYEKPAVVSKELGDGTFEITTTPDNIFWTTDASFAMNVSPIDNFDVEKVDIISLSVNGVTIEDPTQIPPKLLYWYTLPNFEDGTFYNNVSKVTLLHEALTVISYENGNNYKYLNVPITFKYKINQ